MYELGYIIIGWLFGLLSPRIVDLISLNYRKRDIARAVAIEARDLQYRLAIVSFLLAQKYGEITREYLSWLKPMLEQYTGKEPRKATYDLVEYLQGADDQIFSAMIQAERAEEGMGLSLKQYSASFIECHLPNFSLFSTEYQSYIHEFRNHFSILNQEIAGAIQYQQMTWDSSITGDNHQRLAQELSQRYANLQTIFHRVCDRLDLLIKYDEYKI